MLGTSSSLRFLLAGIIAVLSACQNEAPELPPDTVVEDVVDAGDQAPPLPSTPLPAGIDECGVICADAPLYVLSRIQFSAVADDGTSYGFDLDGTSKACDVQDLETRNGRKGIDNRLGELLAVLPPAAVDVLPGIVQTSIDSGQLSMLIEAVGVQDFTTPQETFLVLRMGKGSVLSGADGHILASQTFDLDPDPILGVADVATVGDGQLSAGPFEFEIRLTYLGNKIQFRLFRGIVHFTHDPVADTISGTLGGIVPLDDVTTLANMLGGDDADVRDILLQLLPEFVDAQTVVDGPCDGLSSAITFEGVRAFVFQN